MYQVDQNAYWQAQMMNWGPRVLVAILILIATWLVARAVQWLIQKAIQRAYGLRKRPLPARVIKIGAPWAPYRTVASWYLWRSLELAD